MYNQKTQRFALDLEKTIEVLLYITTRVSDMHLALKILYFADKKHLEKYGRFIAGDRYIAMKNGVVPSGGYDILKIARNNSIFPNNYLGINDTFKVQGDKTIIPQREANLDYLSETDIECLNESIEENKNLTFSQAHHKSVDAAYKNTKKNDEISIEAIVSTLKNKDELMKFLFDS